MNNFLDIVKYLVYGMIVYVLFSYVPQNKLPLADVLVITIVIMMTYMLLDVITPNKSIEKLDPDLIGTPTELNAENNDPEFSNLSTIDGIGDINDMKVEESGNNTFNINSNTNGETSARLVAEVLVSSGLSTPEIDQMLELCKTNKKECNAKLEKMKEDGQIDDTQFEMLKFLPLFIINSYIFLASFRFTYNS